MSYSTIALSARDGDLQQRLIAAAAAEQHPDPQTFVLSNIWAIVSKPDIADDYAYAWDSKRRDIGADATVITDAKILAVIQPMVIADLATP